MRKFTNVLAIALTGLVWVGCAEDDDIVVDDDIAIDDLDGDGDAAVDATEWNGVFAAWDINDDAFLDANEYLFTSGFNDIDLDDDNLISEAEWTSNFAAWDLDSDALLAGAELDPFF